MYNKKSKATAALAIVTALLLVGMMVLMPFLLQNTELEGGDLFGNILGFILFGFIPLYAGAAPFALVALIFGIVILKTKSRKSLIYSNVKLLVASLVLAPPLTLGLIVGRGFISTSAFGAFPVVYVVATALSYLAGIVTQIVTIVILKKSPEEPSPTAEAPAHESTPAE